MIYRNTNVAFSKALPTVLILINLQCLLASRTKMSHVIVISSKNSTCLSPVLIRGDFNVFQLLDTFICYYSKSSI